MSALTGFIDGWGDLVSKDKEYIDIVIFVPLAEELDCCWEIFKPEDGGDLTEPNSDLLHKVISPNPDISIAVIHPLKWGSEQATVSITKVLSRYDVGLICCVGIAGALEGDLKLGDVCFSHTIIYIDSRSKAASGGELQLSQQSFNTQRDILLPFSHFRTHPGLRPYLIEWEQQAISHRPRPVDDLISNEHPKVFGGDIASSIVSADKSFNNLLKKSIVKYWR